MENHKIHTYHPRKSASNFLSIFRTALLLFSFSLSLIVGASLGGLQLSGETKTATDLNTLKRQLTGIDTPWEQRREAALKLKKSGKDGIRLLLSGMASSRKEIQFASRIGVLNYGPKILPSLRKLTQSKKYNFQVGALKCIGDFGGEAETYIPHLGTFTKSKNPQIKEAAVEALINIDGELNIPWETISLKSGAVLRGVIEETTKTNIKVATIRNNKGEVTIMHLNLNPAQVKKKSEAKPELKPLLRARLDSYAKKYQSFEKRSRDIHLEEKLFDGDVVKTYSSETINLRSTTPEPFLKEAIIKIESMGKAYNDFLQAPLVPPTQVKVLIAGSVEEYKDIQRKIFGSYILNPAFYLPAQNLIVAYSNLEHFKEEVAKVKGKHEEIQEEILTIKKKINKHKSWLATEVSKAKSKITSQHAALRRQIDRIKSSSRRRQMKRDIDRQKKAAFKNLDKQIKEIRDQLKDASNLLKEKDKEIDEVNRHNRAFLSEITKDMYSTLAHEYFHAFYSNQVLGKELAHLDLRWLNEGLAMYFEASRFNGIQLFPGAPDERWIKLLQKIQKEGKLFTIHEILDAKPEDFIVHEHSKKRTAEDIENPDDSADIFEGDEKQKDNLDDILDNKEKQEEEIEENDILDGKVKKKKSSKTEEKPKKKKLPDIEYEVVNEDENHDEHEHQEPKKDQPIDHNDPGFRSFLFYTQSWYLVRLLAEDQKLDNYDKLRNFLVEVNESKDVKKAFAKLAGKSIEELEKRYLARLKADDYQIYRWIRLREGVGPRGKDVIFARVTTRINKQVSLRTRDGKILKLNEENVLNLDF